MTFTTKSDQTQSVGIKDAATFLNRKPATLREWERSGKLPDHLLPRRDSKDWRFWSHEQLEEIRDSWMPQHAVPGQGLIEAFKARGVTGVPMPTEEAQERSLEGQRKPRVIVPDTAAA